MDGNLYYRYNHLLFYVKIRPLMDGNEVSEFELAKLEKIDEEEIIEDDTKKLQELMKMLGDVNGRIYQGASEVDNSSQVSEPIP